MDWLTRAIGNFEAEIFKRGEIVDGYKTQLIAAVGAILSVLAAFGLELTEEQHTAVMTLAATVLWPLAMIIMRLVTKGPAKNPVTGKRIGTSTARTPWWVVILLLPLMFMGCSAQYRAPETVYESLLIADKYGELVTHTVNDLRRAQVIPRDEHQEALDVLQKALDRSRDARRAYQLSRWSDAKDGLGRVESLLHVVASLVTPYLPETPENQAFINRYGGA